MGTHKNVSRRSRVIHLSMPKSSKKCLLRNILSNDLSLFIKIKEIISLRYRTFVTLLKTTLLTIRETSSFVCVKETSLKKSRVKCRQG